MLIARSVHPLPGEAERKERLLALIDGFSSRRVLIVGDLIADEFIYGEVARVSREAPVLILKYDATEMVAGGAGNAANNVAALGGRARLAGLVGADAEGRRLLASFPRGVDRTQIVRSQAYRTPVKTRILAGGVHAARQQVVRIDRETRLAAGPRREPRVREEGGGAGRLVRRGACCPTTDRVSSRRSSPTPFGRPSPAGAGAAPVPVLVDSRHRLSDYRGPDDVHAERIGGRAGCSASRSTTISTCSSGPAGCCCAVRACRPCSSRAAAAAWRCSSPSSRPSTFRSSARTKSPTSPARATP